MQTAEALWQWLRKYDDDQPRADDGKWTEGGGGGGGGSSSGGGGGPSVGSDRATASLADPEFVARHGERLSRAGDEARSNFPGREASDHAHAAAAAHIHGEATRIHAEEDAHGGDEKLREVGDEARSMERSRGGYLEDQHAAAMSAIADEKRSQAEARADRDNEDAAVSAGHVTTEARDVAAAYEAEHEQRQQQISEHTAQLDQAHKDAADALASLEEYASDSDDELTFDHSLTEEFRNTQNTLDEGNDADYSRDIKPRERPLHPDLDLAEDFPGYQPHPDSSERELSDEEYDSQLAAHEAWHGAALAEHDKQFAEHHAEFKRRAEAAQASLEQLHAKQVAAAATLKQIDKDADKAHALALKQIDDMEEGHHVKHDAFAGHERDDDGFVDDNIAAAHERATRGDATMRAHARARIEERGARDLGEALDALNDETKATTAALKALAKITGRKPALAGKPGKAKKSANRPGSAAGASVGDMPPAQRFKLKLTKLDFLSLVDVPAQQTANIRLIKRADSGEDISGTMKIVKVGSGDDPLVHCWAFTCTDETGAPYHDLQGDAVTQDFIKAAEEWVAAGGAVDEMHDGKQKARISFAYPIDRDIVTSMLGKAAGEATQISGLMAAIRPTPDQLAKIRSGKYTGVSIAGTGVREAIKAAPRNKPKTKKPKRASPYKRVGKIAALTSVTDGHQHTIDLEDPACSWSDALCTSYQTAEGATEGHSHAWVYDAATGAITIALDSGHDHTVTAVVPPEVIAAAAAGDDEPETVPCAVRDEPSAPAATVVVVAARAPAANSTLSEPAETVKQQEQGMPSEADKIADLEKRLDNAEKRATLSDAQRVFLKSLEGTDAAQFLGLTAPQRDLQIAEVEKANTVVYESPFTKRVYRMNDSLELIEMAKAADAARTREAEAEKREAIAKYAERGRETLTHFAKGTKGDLRTRFMRMLDSEFPVPAEYEEAVKAFKSANYALELLEKAQGVNPHVDPTSVDAPPIEKFNAARVEFAKAKFKTDAPSEAQLRSVTGEFIKTAKGAQLYAEQSNHAQA